MQLDLLLQGQLIEARGLGVKVGHVRRRRKRRLSKQLLFDPNRSLDGMRLVAVRVAREERSVREQPTASLFRSDRHRPEGDAFHSFHSIELCEVLVEHREVRVNQGEEV